MIKIDNSFPIYLVKRFYIPFFNKHTIIDTVLKNRKYMDINMGYNYPILDDRNNFFKKLYSKFYNLSKKRFKFTKHESSKETCWAYASNNTVFYEYWHNHIKTSTINSVYYLAIPKNDNVTISFRLDGNILDYKINSYDLLIFPDFLDHKPNRCFKPGHRISINMEITCNETSQQIFSLT